LARSNPESTLNNGNFKSFFQRGLNPKERLTIHCIKDALHNYLRNLTSVNVSVGHPHGGGDGGGDYRNNDSYNNSMHTNWQQYGTMTSKGGEAGDGDNSESHFHFDRAKFMDPRRCQMQCQVEFLEMMTQTQLFLQYVEDQCRTAQRRKQRLLQKSRTCLQAMMISYWLAPRWRRYAQELQDARKRDDGDNGNGAVKIVVVL
jgi:hypothetical protein